MAHGTATAVLLMLALIAANLPWLSERRGLVGPLGSRNKNEWWRLGEWLGLYGLVGVVALGLERRVEGGIHPQGWEFYVVTLCLFAVFALPGFIYHHDLRYHLRRHYRRRAR